MKKKKEKKPPKIASIFSYKIPPCSPLFLRQQSEIQGFFGSISLIWILIGSEFSAGERRRNGNEEDRLRRPLRRRFRRRCRGRRCVTLPHRRAGTHQRRLRCSPRPRIAPRRLPRRLPLQLNTNLSSAAPEGNSDFRFKFVFPFYAIWFVQ